VLLLVWSKVYGLMAFICPDPNNCSSTIDATP